MPRYLQCPLILVAVSMAGCSKHAVEFTVSSSPVQSTRSAPRTNELLNAASLQGEEPSAPITELAIPVECDDLAVKIPDSRNFDRSQIPERILDLEGMRIRVRGYVYPAGETRQVTELLLIGEVSTKPVRLSPDTWDPPIQYFIDVQLDTPRDIDIDFHFRHPVAVVGTLKIEPFETPDGVLMLLYTITEASLERVEKRQGYHPGMYRSC